MLESSWPLRDLGFHLILKDNRKPPTKLNMLFTNINSIKTPGRLSAYMKSIQG